MQGKSLDKIRLKAQITKAEIVMFLQLMKCNLTSQFNNLPLNFRVRFHSVTVKFMIPQASQIKTMFIAHLHREPDCQCGAVPAWDRWETGSRQRASDLCFSHLVFDPDIQSGNHKWSWTASKQQLFFSFYFCSTVETSGQVQIVTFMCCCSSPPYTILAEGKIPSAITPKLP